MVASPDSAANLVAQGSYSRAAFDIIRTHHIDHGDIATVTLWGLNDGRSWRASPYPLLFDDDLTAKPAFYGAVYDAHVLDADVWNCWERPVLPTVVP
jgi:endo-1,4-beta-xylanase